MRSKLFVPGTRPELFSKALAGEADALSFDLQDAVSPARRAEARNAGQAMLATPAAAAAMATGKTLIVRVNLLGSPHFAADLAAVVQPGLQLLNLPKPDLAPSAGSGCEPGTASHRRSRWRLRSASAWSSNGVRECTITSLLTNCMSPCSSCMRWPYCGSAINCSSRSNASHCCGVTRGSAGKSFCAATMFLRFTRMVTCSGSLPMMGQAQ